MVRHVYLTDRHSPDVEPSWFGESIGHYENGDTLGADTIGLPTRTRVQGHQTPHTKRLRVIERYHIAESGGGLDVVAYVGDPGGFTTAVDRTQHYRRKTDALLAEEICAENNGDPFNHRIMPDPDGQQAGFLSDARALYR
jgi:hypothetical protein